MKNFWPILGFIIMIGLYAGFSVMYQQEHQKREAKEAAEKEAAMVAEADIEKKFEIFLNGFMKRIADEAEDYIKERRLISKLVAPENVSSPSYVLENAQVMKQTLDGLNKRMDVIMSQFGDADNQVSALLKDQPEAKRQEIEKAWYSVKKKQGSMYMAFFASEQDILQAYSDLMVFYEQKIQDMHYDPLAKAMTFTNEQDRLREKALRLKIDDLAAQQKNLLGDTGVGQSPSKP